MKKKIFLSGSILLTTIGLTVFTNSYSQNINKVKQRDSLFNKLIIGTWQSGSSEFTYFKNGTYSARFSKGNIDSGSWHIKEGIFVIKPEPFGIERRYNILSLSSKLFKYQLGNKSIGDSIYIERKVIVQ